MHCMRSPFVYCFFKFQFHFEIFRAPGSSDTLIHHNLHIHLTNQIIIFERIKKELNNLKRSAGSVTLGKLPLVFKIFFLSLPITISDEYLYLSISTTTIKFFIFFLYSETRLKAFHQRHS